AAPGLFPGTAAGKQAAQRCCDEGYLHAAPAGPGWAITDKGLAYLLGQLSPREVLEDFVRVLEAREHQVHQLLGLAQQMHKGVEGLRAHVVSVLARLSSPAGDLKKVFQDFHHDRAPADPEPAILSARGAGAGGGAGEDCPLPELYPRVQTSCPQLSIGAFHDTLRRLVQEDRLYLHPWTGPLYAIPEPPFALMIGHEVA